MHKDGFRNHCVAVVVLFAVALTYSWSVASNLTSAIPGTPRDHDVAAFVWNVGWVKHALETEAELLRTNSVLIPMGADLRLHTYGLLFGLMAYPFTPLLGVVGAYNLVLIAMLFLNGAASYALVHREVGRWPAALVAAVCVMLRPPLLYHFTVGRPSFSSIWIVVGALLSLRSLLDHPRPANVVFLGGFMVAALFMDFQLVLFAFIWLSLYGCYRVWRNGWSKTLGFTRAAALTAAAAIFLAPFFWIFFPALTAEGYSLPRLEDMAAYSYRFWDYADLKVAPLIYGYEFLAAGVGAVVLFGRRGPYRFWLAASLFLMVLTLGPTLQPTDFPLPFRALTVWFPLRHFRTPYRLLMVAHLGLGVVAGYFLRDLLGRIRSRQALAILIVGLVAGRLLLAILQKPFPIQAYPTYTVYQRLGRQAGDFALLEVPVGVRSGLERIGHGGEVLQFYQHIHRKRIINGMVARLPNAVFQFYRRHPSLIFLSGAKGESDPHILARDFDDVLRWSRAGYVLVHRRMLENDPQTRIISFLNRQPQIRLTEVEADLLVYRVR